MGEQSQFHRRFFSGSKSKRLKSLALSATTTTTTTTNVSNHSQPSNGLMSAEHWAQSVVREQLGPGAEFETRPKEVLGSSPRLSRQSATRNGNFQDVDNPTTTRASDEIETQGDSSISSVQLPDGSLSTMRHIDEDEDDDDHGDREEQNEIVNKNDKQQEQIDIQTSEEQQVVKREHSSGGCHPSNGCPQPHNNLQPDNHIETLSYHPDNQVTAGPAAQQKPSGGESRRIRDSKLFKATKAILLFRRATTSLGHAHSHSHAPSPSGGFGTSTRSFVSSLWRQNTADNSTCTRSSRMDSIASSNNNSYFGGGGGSGGLTFLNGATKNSSSQVSLKQNNAMSPAVSSSSFSLPRFIVPKMNALRLPIVCHIKSLDGELMREVFIHRYELGQYIMDNLKVSLDMKDAKYFGLKVANSLDEQEDVRQPWLDLNESVYKQISKHSRVITIKNVEVAAASQNQSTSSTSFSTSSATTKSVDFYLRIKYYPPNLARIQDQFLKQYLWLQLRRDLRLGKLTSSMNNLTYLMACVLQYELGDYKQELVNEQMPQLNVLPNQDLIEQQALEIWQHRLAGSKRHLVLMQFLRASVILETYGFDYYPVRDHQRQRAYLLGFNYAGIKTIRNGRIINHFRWHNLSKISHERRMIIFHIYPNENSKRKQILGFKCLSNEDCQNLYMRLLEQKYFFTVDLTYFDKSIRRPSHLTESSIGHLADPQQQQRQQQLGDDWSTSPTGANRTRQRTLDTDNSFGDEGDEEPEEEDEEEEGDDDDDDGEDEFSANRTKRRRYAAPAHSGAVSRQETSSREGDEKHRVHADENPIGGAPGNNCACAECKRAPRPAGCSVPNVVKANSLQESTGYAESADYNRFELTHYFSHPSSPVFESPTPAGESGHSDPEPPTPRASHFPTTPVPTLQRQPSMAKYAADFAAPPPGGSTDRYNSMQPQPSMPTQKIGELRGNPSSGLQEIGSQQGGGTSASQRLVEWTEQVFVQPATLLASSSNQWPTVVTGQAAVASQIPGQTQDGQRAMTDTPTTTTSLSGDLFLQAMRFCLLIVLMNVLLRISDEIANVLIDFLSFGPSAQGDNARPARPDT